MLKHFACLINTSFSTVILTQVALFILIPAPLNKRFCSDISWHLLLIGIQKALFLQSILQKHKQQKQLLIGMCISSCPQPGPTAVQCNYTNKLKGEKICIYAK
jgi:hypothetical protein